MKHMLFELLAVTLVFDIFIFTTGLSIFTLTMAGILALTGIYHIRRAAMKERDEYICPKCRSVWN